MRGVESRGVELASRHVVVVDAFLGSDVCRRILREAEQGDWVPSGVAEVPARRHRTRRPALGRSTYGTGRSSSTLAVSRLSGWMERTLKRIELRLWRRFRIEPRQLEPWQVTRYARGDAFDYHLDCGAWRSHPSGERRRTVMIYVEQPARGGATHFRALRLRIAPVAGRLVLWNNLLPTGQCDHAMIHAGRPVWQGRKTILTTWERERRYMR